MNTEFGERLKTARKHAGFTQTQLAKLVGVSQGTLSELEKIAYGSAYAYQLATHCGVSPKWLTEGEGMMISHEVREPTAKHEIQSSNVESIVTKKQVPLISWVRAGGWGEIDDHNPDTTETVPANYSQPGRYAFALSVDGDSMTTNIGLSFPHGCIIIVDPDRIAKVGDFVVAKDVISQKATFKRLASDGGRWYLRPQNKEYPTLEIDHPEKRVIGVVIEFSIGAKLC